MLILIIGLVLTGIATFYTERKVESDSKKEFALNCNEIKIKTANRLRACAQLLQTCSAFFTSSDTVTREEWKSFNKNAKYQNFLPGMQGLGFSLLVTKNQLEHHIETIRKEGFSNYNVWPKGDSASYTPIIYLEPFLGPNLKAFGYNPFSDSTRRKAMELARDSDMAVLSGKVILIQNSEGDRQSGTLMYAPVYRRGMPVKTIEQRRSAITGWISSPYHMNDLIAGILGHWDTAGPERIHLQIFEEQISSTSLLYDSQGNESPLYKNQVSRTVTLQIKPCMKKWVLVFTQSDPHIFYFQDMVTIVFVSGIFISGLLFLLSLSLFNTRNKAHKIASDLTLEVRESELRIREVLENSLDASYKLNLITRSYDYLSPAYSRISGYSVDEMRIMPVKIILEFLHPDDVQNVEQRIAQSMADTSMATCHLEYRFRHKGGAYRWFYDKYTVVRDLNGQPVSMIGSVSDITDRKQIEETLRNERLLLRTLIDNIPDSIYCLDLECRKTLANSTDVRYMGAESEEEVLGKNDFDFYPKEIAEKFFEVDYSVIQTGKPILNIEELLIDLKGETRWLLTSKLPMFNNEGQIIGLLGYGRDITERKQSEEEIRIKNEELQKLNASKDKLFSIIAHDLRSPFNGFLGLTQMMAEDLSSMTQDEIQKIAEAMKNSATTIYRLLENLLQWSTLQQGRMVFNPKVLRLSSVISDCIAMSLPAATLKEIEIETFISDDIEVYADSNMLQTIFRNLVANSVKFTEKGGKITLLAKNLNDKTLEILIQDTGIGMSKEIIKGLFLIDVNTSRKGTDGESSTGLGLIICKEFIEKNGGEIRVESEEGVGSKFYFTIPANVNHS